jgi:curved DNA-binding protein CbpA
MSVCEQCLRFLTTFANLKQTFTISPNDLKTRYKSLMMELHPDRHVDNTVKDAKYTEATHVTHAYDVLSHPLRRALHLLELRGSGIDESDAVSFLLSTSVHYFHYYYFMNELFSTFHSLLIL